MKFEIQSKWYKNGQNIQSVLIIRQGLMLFSVVQFSYLTLNSNPFCDLASDCDKIQPQIHIIHQYDSTSSPLSPLTHRQKSLWKPLCQTHRNNALSILQAFLNPVKLTSKINHCSPQGFFLSVSSSTPLHTATFCHSQSPHTTALQIPTTSSIHPASLALCSVDSALTLSCRKFSDLL